MRRIVVDTNCLLMCISANSPYHKIWTDFIEHRVTWCVSTEVLAEYYEILARHTNLWFAEVVVDTIVNNESTVRVTPSFRFQLIQSDPDDNKFVDCAICGSAEYIVSNDSHFKILDCIDFPKVKVVRIEDYV